MYTAAAKPTDSETDGERYRPLPYYSTYLPLLLYSCCLYDQLVTTPASLYQPPLPRQGNTPYPTYLIINGVELGQHNPVDGVGSVGGGVVGQGLVELDQLIDSLVTYQSLADEQNQVGLVDLDQLRGRAGGEVRQMLGDTAEVWFVLTVGGSVETDISI